MVGGEGTLNGAVGGGGGGTFVYISPSDLLIASGGGGGEGATGLGDSAQTGTSGSTPPGTDSGAGGTAGTGGNGGTYSSFDGGGGAGWVGNGTNGGDTDDTDGFGGQDGQSAMPFAGGAGDVLDSPSPDGGYGGGGGGGYNAVGAAGGGGGGGYSGGGGGTGGGGDEGGGGGGSYFGPSFTGITKAFTQTGNGYFDITLISATPTIATTATPSSTTVGGAITDVASVSGGLSPTGTVTFDLYSNDTARGTPLFSSTVSLTSGTATSSSYTTTAVGTDYWVDTYNGDGSNGSLSSGDAAEPVSISAAAPTITSTPNAASVTLSTGTVRLSDTAHLTGGYSPIGTITFTLYQGTTLLDTEAIRAHGNGDYDTPVAYTPPMAGTVTGTYQWDITYSGDSNNSPLSDIDDPAERTVVIPATPTISTAAQPTAATVGDSIADSATITGYGPTGTVTFNLYDTSDASDSPIFTDTESLTTGTATSASYTTTAGGTDYWVDTYNGDGNNNSVTSGDADEPVTISTSNPTITTSAQPTIAPVGTSIADSATVTGGAPISTEIALSATNGPAGTVTFNLYNNDSASGTPLFTDTEFLTAGTATSASYTTTAAGTDYWVDTYSGPDSSTVTSGPADEPVTITPATTTISSVPSATAVTLSTGTVTLSDTADLTGGYRPTGTITFTLYQGSTPVDTETTSVSSGNGTYSTPTGYILPSSGAVTGTYQWDVNYGGDGNNSPTSDNNDPAEQTVVSAATPSISTTAQPTSTTVGSSISDQARVSGYNPTGTVTFKLYTNSNASGLPLFSVTESLTAGTATSTSYTTTGSGTDYWVDTYNGDSNNSSVTSGDAAEPVTITAAAKATVKISTCATPSSGTVLASSLKDSATLSGGNSPTGTLTFTLISPNGSTATTERVTVTGNKTYTTPTAFLATQVGTYYWVDSYSGDSKNSPVTSGAKAEPVVIAKAKPCISVSCGSTSMLIHCSSRTFTGKISAGGLIPPGSITVTLGGVQKTATIQSNGSFSVNFSTGSLPVGTYSVTFAYAGNSDFNSASCTDTLKVSYGIKPVSNTYSCTAASTLPIQILLIDSAGHDVDTTKTTIAVTGIALASSPNKTVPLPPGNPAAGRFTANSAGDEFTLNLKTTGLPAGQYLLYFSITADPVSHCVTFTIKK